MIILFGLFFPLVIAPDNILVSDLVVKALDILVGLLDQKLEIIRLGRFGRNLGWLQNRRELGPGISCLQTNA